MYIRIFKAIYKDPCGEIHSEFLTKILSVPFTMLLPGRVSYIYYHSSHLALDPRKLGPVFTQCSLPSVLLKYFCVLPLLLESIGLGTVGHEWCREFYILYSSCVM